jgi:hypothetical protein
MKWPSSKRDVDFSTGLLNLRDTKSKEDQHYLEEAQNVPEIWKDRNYQNILRQCTRPCMRPNDPPTDNRKVEDAAQEQCVYA